MSFLYPEILFPLILPALLILFIALFIIPLVFMIAWNISIPVVFRLPRITYWQAFGFLLVVSIIFNGAFMGLKNNSSTQSSVENSDIDDLRKDIWKVSNKVDQLEQQLNELNQQLQPSPLNP
ncbi:MAG: hypothetical protein SFY66_17125 [Oculatellaceae cyanobacterium bins.114]|nr:hypothetical protein [Oculatellaceae cyanobacterium bins.114]